MLMGTPHDSDTDEHHLRKLGYEGGRTLRVEYFSAEGRNERFATLADDCVKRRVDVIVATTTPAVRRIEIEDADGERTEIEFKDVEINKEVEDSEVGMSAPAGTREVHPLGKPPEPPAPKRQEPGT